MEEGWKTGAGRDQAFADAELLEISGQGCACDGCGVPWRAWVSEVFGVLLVLALVDNSSQNHSMH